MTLEIVDTFGDDTLARVFVAKTEDGALIEFVESVQPPRPRAEKWVLIISTLKGCPVRCVICDAGGNWKGRLSDTEMIAQIDYLVRRRFPDGDVSHPMLKIQFARMGDPMFNPAVLDVLDGLPERYPRSRVMPSISTIAPKGCQGFLEKLSAVKNRWYADGWFQMQFSVHTTCDIRRRELIPVSTFPLQALAAAGDRFYAPGDRKITLNFAAVRGYPLDPVRIADVFDSSRFIIKLTPINPTRSVMAAGVVGAICPNDESSCQDLLSGFQSHGFETIVSIGELEENRIGSNCGMYVGPREAGSVQPA